MLQLGGEYGAKVTIGIIIQLHITFTIRCHLYSRGVKVIIIIVAILSIQMYNNIKDKEIN